MNKVISIKNLTSTVNSDLYVNLLEEMEKHTNNSLVAKDAVFIPFPKFTSLKSDLQEIYDHARYIDLNIFKEDFVVQGFKIYSKYQMSLHSDAIRAYIVQSIQTINPNNPNFKKFTEEFSDKLEGKISEYTTNTVQAIFENAKSLVKNFPEKQKEILAATQLFLKLLEDSFRDILHFINTLLVNSVELFKTKKIWQFCFFESINI